MKLKALGLVILLALLTGPAACQAEPDPTATAVVPTTRPGVFSREQLIEDAQQLAEIIENTHPDPYIRGGGRIPSIVGCSASWKPSPQKG